MLKMVIRMNDDKITAENKYRLDGIYNTINHTFQTVGLPRMEDGSGALVSVTAAERGILVCSAGSSIP